MQYKSFFFPGTIFFMAPCKNQIKIEMLKILRRKFFDRCKELFKQEMNSSLSGFVKIGRFIE